MKILHPNVFKTDMFDISESHSICCVVVFRLNTNIRLVYPVPLSSNSFISIFESTYDTNHALHSIKSNKSCIALSN